MSDQAQTNAGASVKRPPTTPAQAAELRSKVLVTQPVAAVSPDQRQAMIAEAAYYLALQRDFEPGHEVEDWLLAQSQIDGALAPTHPLASASDSGHVEASLQPVARRG